MEINPPKYLDPQVPRALSDSWIHWHRRVLLVLGSSNPPYLDCHGLRSLGLPRSYEAMSPLGP